jgi:hypothetical protein
MKKKNSTVELFKSYFDIKKKEESIDINKMSDIKYEFYNCKINVSELLYISTKIAKFEIN